eukprot:GFUD01018183.1.p1 GENE.GFUD01018183.1~~GFUD01018183.1.p1  ORF type:complete len:384 (+),score=99.30 GFUD01018183.1:278-1429(+)
MSLDLRRNSTEVKTEVTSTIRAKLEWSVDKLDLDQTESRKSIRSPPFTVPVCGEDTEWFISIYPKGTALHGRGEQAAYIYLHHTPPGGHTGSDTEYSMAFRTDCGSWPEDHVVCRKGMRTTEEWRKGGYGYMKMCPTEDLANMYVDDLSVSSVGDTMTAVTVIVKRKLVIVVWLKIAVPEENRRRSDEFNSNMKNVFEMKNFSDVVLKCNGQDFPCHKVVLSARSDVFKAMLENEMREAHDNVIEIVDSSPEIVTMMVEHIYTGKIPEVAKLKQLAPEILHVAVKYNLPSLISVCEDTLLNELKSANAIKTFIYVDRYMPTSKLREQVLKFLCRNAREVVGVGDWTDFIKQYPELATEMFRSVIDNTGQAGQQTKLSKKSRIG